MSEHTPQPPQTRDQEGQRRQRELDEVTWSQTSPAEREILQEVQTTLLQRRAAQRQRAALAPTPSKFFSPWLSSWRMVFSGVSAFTCLALLWGLWLRHNTKLPALRGTSALLSAQSTTADVAQVQVQTSLKQRGQLRDTGIWTLHVSGRTAFRLKRGSTRHVQIKMRSGRFRAHIRPKQMTQFEVACAGQFHVKVTGTVFSVEQSQSWLRVEVMRGSVALEHKGKALRTLRASQGVRLDLRTQKLHFYTLPTVALPSVTERLRWLHKTHPSQFHLYARDLFQAPHHSAEKRRRWGDLVTGLLQQRGQHKQATRLWHQLQKAGLYHKQQAFAMLQEASLCHSRKQTSRRCLRSYQRLLSREGRTYQDTALFFLIDTYSHHSNLAGAVQRKAQLCQRYKHDFPQGTYRKDVAWRCGEFPAPRR